MRRHHSDKPGEIRPRDQIRMTEVYRILTKAGIPDSNANNPIYGGTPGTVPAWANVSIAMQYHAVEIYVWASGAKTGADRVELAARIRQVLWASGYLVRVRYSLADAEDTETTQPILMDAYRPDWGGELPQMTMNTPGVAHYLGISPATWRGYVSREQAPEADAPVDGRTPAWTVTTIDRYVRDRPGRGTRTDLTTSKETTVQNTQRLAEQVNKSIDDNPHYDVVAIVEEIGEKYGFDVASIDDIPSEEYWAIIESHDQTA